MIIDKILKISAKNKFILSAVFGLASAGLLTLFLITKELDSWKIWNFNYDRWISIQATCVKLQSEASQELDKKLRELEQSGEVSLARFKLQSLNPYDRFLGPSDHDEEKILEAIKQTHTKLANASCPLDWTGRLEENRQTKPPDLINFALRENHWDKTEIATLGFASFVFLFVAIDFVNRIHKTKNRGLRRLGLVSSIIAAIIYFSNKYNSEKDTTLIGYSLLVFAIFNVTWFYGIHVYQWISAGFHESKGPKEEAHLHQKNKSSEFLRQPQAIDDRPTNTETETYQENNTRETQAPLSKPATYWPRAWARCIDLFVCWVCGSLLAEAFPKTLDPSKVEDIIISVLIGQSIICVFAYLYEYFSLLAFGATLGKIALGLKVLSTDHRPLTSSEAKKRSWDYLVSGLYLFFWVPMFQITSAYFAWKKINQSQPWELTTKTYVSQKPVSNLRTWFLAGISIALILLVAGVSQAQKNHFRHQVQDLATSRQN